MVECVFRHAPDGSVKTLDILGDIHLQINCRMIFVKESTSSVLCLGPLPKTLAENGGGHGVFLVGFDVFLKCRYEAFTLPEGKFLGDT